MITIGITEHQGEYRVFWKENGRYDESKAYYTDDPADAVYTLIDILERTQAKGKDITVSDAHTTQDLLTKYPIIEPAKEAQFRVVSEEKVDFDPKTMGSLITGLGEYRKLESPKHPPIKHIVWFRDGSNFIRYGTIEELSEQYGTAIKIEEV